MPQEQCKKKPARVQYTCSCNWYNHIHSSCSMAQMYQSVSLLIPCLRLDYPESVAQF